MFMDWEAQVFAVKQSLVEQFVMLDFAQTEFSMGRQFIVYMHKMLVDLDSFYPTRLSKPI